MLHSWLCTPQHIKNAGVYTLALGFVYTMRMLVYKHLGMYTLALVVIAQCLATESLVLGIVPFHLFVVMTTVSLAFLTLSSTQLSEPYHLSLGSYSTEDMSNS